MGIQSTCPVNLQQATSSVKTYANPKKILMDNYPELLKERVIVDASGKEIGGRLDDVTSKATEAAKNNRKEGESLEQAVVRNALSILNYDPCGMTLGGMPTGPAYERPIPDNVLPQNFGHEKVPYPMSDYPHLSYMPVGGLGAPMCEIDYSTCYFKDGQMVQDKPIRIMTVTVDGKEYDLQNTQGTYFALYPFSEREYDLPIPISVTQYSPFIPGNYRASSLPMEFVEINAENPTDKPIEVTFTLSQENILGWYPKKGEDNPKDPSGILVWDKQNKGNTSEAFASDNIAGVVFKKSGNQKDLVRAGAGIAGQIAIASENIPGKVTVTPAPSKAGENTGAVKITFTLQSKEKIVHPVAVTYDNPYYNFQYDATTPTSPGVRMPKFYTRFYGTDGQNAELIASDALENRAQWKEKAVSFQRTITDDPALPDFFKQALLNELYVLPETGIWEADQGRFAYLESIDYKMYNTSDVNSYTWAVLTLFPELERKDLIELSNLVPLSDPRRRWFGTDRWANMPPEEWKHLYWAPVKDPGAVCHDLGGLFGQGIFPFTNTCNEFDWSNANMWIDLAPKFALRCWRYYSFMDSQTGEKDKEFIKTVYPSVKMAMDTLEERWANKETHIPMSKGVPDWTYDTISGEGYTPNVVTQWLGALEAASSMALITGDLKTYSKYQKWLRSGRPVLQKLWNQNGYYNAFVTPDASKINPNIHSDMLFGDFYTRMVGLKPVVPNHNTTSSLNTIYRINGLEWGKVGSHGPLGLVNLRGPNGEQNKTEQGDEGWTGTMLLNAAYQIKVGQETNNPELVQNGWNIIQGFYNVIYSNSPDSQYWFGRTPEGYSNPDDIMFNDPNKKYKEGKVLQDGTAVPATGRAPKYMRPLAIWAVYAALKDNKMPFNIYSERIPDLPDTFPLPYGRQ